MADRAAHGRHHVIFDKAWASIAPVALADYKKLLPPHYQTFGDYDCHSVMHYRVKSFAGKKYFKPKSGLGCLADMGGSTLSETDIETVRALYA